MKLKLRQWFFDRSSSSKQIAILPNFDIFWDAYIGRESGTVVCISFAWIFWCLELWINPSEDLI